VIQGRQVPPDSGWAPALLTVARLGLLVLGGFVAALAVTLAQPLEGQRILGQNRSGLQERAELADRPW